MTVNMNKIYTDAQNAYYLALNTDVDIERLQEIACQNSQYALLFARDIPGADIEFCQKAACKDPINAFCFACDIPSANLKKCQEACKGTDWEEILNQYLMEKALK